MNPFKFACVRGPFILSISLFLSAAFAEPADKVKLLLGFQLNAVHAGFTYGIQKGIFKAENIDLELENGKGGLTGAERLVSESPPRFGYLSASNIVELSESEAKARVIAQVTYTNAMGIIVTQASGVRSAKSLKGKKIGFSKGEAPFALFAAFLDANGMKLSDVNVVFMSQDEKVEAIKKGAVDGVGKNTSQIHSFSKQTGKPLFPLNYATNGLPMIGEALIVSVKNMKDEKDRELNCRMARATLRSWTEAGKDPEGAIQSLKKYLKNVDDVSAKKSWDAAFSTSQTRKQLQKPFGYSFVEDWKKLIDIMKFTKQIKNSQPVEEYFSNACIDG